MWNKIHIPVFPPRKVTTNRGKQVIYITMKMTQMAENKQMVLNLKYIQEQDHKGYGA